MMDDQSKTNQENSLLDLDKYRITNGSVNTIYYIPNFITQNEEESLLRNVDRVPKPKWTQLSNRRLQNWGGVPMPKGMLAEEIPPWLKFYTDKIGQLNIFNNNIPNHILVNEYLPGQGIMPHLDGSLFYPTISTINLGCHTMLNFYKPINAQSDSMAMASPDLNNSMPTFDAQKKDDEQNPDLSHNTSTPSSKNGSNNEVIKSWADRLAFRLLLEPRSLVILKDQAYEYYLHGIDETKSDEITSNVLNLNSTTAYDNNTSCVGTVIERSKTRISLTIRFVPKTTKKTIFKLGK